MVWRRDDRGRVADGLLTLFDQIDKAHPGRKKSDDGTIGDLAHLSRTSDHNIQKGIVFALDITHDPAHGVDTYVLADVLRQKRDPRIRYVISNGRIFGNEGYAEDNGGTPYVWARYDGKNKHDRHMHISSVKIKPLYDDKTPWDLGNFGKAVMPSEPEHTSETKPGARVFVGIMATIFSDTTIAYTDVAPGWNNRPGCALPARFPPNKPRPKVKVTNPRTGKSVVCEIMDVGPWNTNDPWWETGHRPQAESGRDLGGRNTNKAGIDLTPAAAKAIGHNGLEKVDVEFV